MIEVLGTILFLVTYVAIILMVVRPYKPYNSKKPEREQTGHALEIDNIIPPCSSCHGSTDTLGCCTSPETKVEYPDGFHTVSGGLCAQDISDFKKAERKER